MQPSRVEHRLLQAVLNPIGGDRVTLALVHWDGRTLRRALRPSVPSELDDARVAAKRTLRGIERTLDHVDLGLDFGLADLLPVRAGDAAGLAWTPVTVGHTRNSEAHFQELVKALRLAPLARSEEREVGWRQVEHDLATLGERLRADPTLATNVAVQSVVRGFSEYRAPLSWKNGRWTHALGLGAPGETTKVADALKRVTGVLDLQIPRDAGLVVVFPEPVDVLAKDELLRGLEYLRASSDVPRVDACALPVAGGQLDTSSLEQRVRRDLAH